MTADFLKIDLEDKRHRIEKKRDIKYRIRHRENLPCDRVWDEISETDRRRRNHGKVKCIKITPALSPLKVMYEECSEEPTCEKYHSDEDKFFMMEVDIEHTV